ncbi:MAG: hypothetical protein LBI20_03305 [Holosporales bacterium]|nr:hypothetical protein [Holosporales bacterium]
MITLCFSKQSACIRIIYTIGQIPTWVFSIVSSITPDITAITIDGALLLNNAYPTTGIIVNGII